MSAQAEWSAIYARGEQLNKWPWSDLVSLVNRYGAPLSGKRVIELGCGTGGNIPFFEDSGCEYYGLDAADVGHQCSMSKVECADFTKIIWHGPKVDIVCDRAAVCHNPMDGIQRCIAMVYDALKPGGLYIGVDWFSTEHQDRAQFDGLTVTLFDDRMIRDVFSRFEIVSMEHKVIARVQPARGQFASWNFVARKA